METLIRIKVPKNRMIEATIRSADGRSTPLTDGDTVCFVVPSEPISENLVAEIKDMAGDFAEMAIEKVQQFAALDYLQKNCL